MHATYMLKMQFSLLDFDIEQTYARTQASFSKNESQEFRKSLRHTVSCLPIAISAKVTITILILTWLHHTCILSAALYILLAAPLIMSAALCMT